MRVIALVAPGTILLAALAGAGPVLAQSSNTEPSSTGPSSYDRPMRATRPDAPSFVFPPKSPPSGDPQASPRPPVEPSLLPEDQARRDREARERLRAEVQRDQEKAQAEESAAREAADRKAKADAKAQEKARERTGDKADNTIVIDTAACRWAQRHVAAADVEYRPGVDVNGRPVAPADLPGSNNVALPKEIQIGITADIAKRFKLPPNALYAGEAYIGTVAVDTLSGKVTFNGQPIDNDAERELVALCAKQAP